MEIKDFKKGQEVFIVRMYKGRNTNPVISKGIVEKVGIKYITDTGGNKYQKHFLGYNMLVEKCDYGEHRLLFASEDEAEMYIEKDRLEIWLSTLKTYGKGYTLEQLRKVKEILDN